MTGPGCGGDPCAHFRELAAEYAVADIDGRERSGLVEHLERCPSCRHAACEYAEVADALLALLPTVEPPLGFEVRALARLECVRSDGRVGAPPVATGTSDDVARPVDEASTASRPGPRARWHPGGGIPRRDSRRVVLVGWALLLGVVGWAVVSGVVTAAADAPPGPSAAPATTVSPPPNTGAVLHSPVIRGRESIGEIYARPGRHAGDPTWLYLSLDRDGPGSAPGTLTLQLCRRGGATSTAGALTVTDGYAAWAGPVAADPLDLTGAQLLEADGTRYAGAELADP